MKRFLIPLVVIVGVLAGGCIVQFSSIYEDATDNTHFVGLARNLTAGDVVSASVEVRMYDSSGNLVATEFASPCTRTLQDHASSPIEAIIPPGVTVDEAETVVRPITVGTKAVPDLDFDNIAIGEDGTTTHLTGDITNNDDINYYAVRVCAAIFDDHGDVVRVGRDYTTPSTIDSSDSGEFDIAIADMPSDAEQYQLWVDAVTRSPSDVTAPVVLGPSDLSDILENTGLLSPTANAIGTVGFLTPANAYDDDSDEATGDPDDSHVYSVYGIDLPSGANVEGIEVRLDWFLSATSGSNSMDVELSWDGGTTWTDAMTDDVESTAQHTTILGGSSEDWGHSWDESDLSDANLRVRVTCDAASGNTCELDWIPIKVYYTP